MDNNENLVIFHKYEIRHVDGTPLKGKKYFVLRLDSPDPKESSRVNAAMAAYKGDALSANSKAWRDELEEILRFLMERGRGKNECILTSDEFTETMSKLSGVIESLPDGKKWKWVNGDNYEYEFAYCSKCGHMEHAGWYTHAEAKEKIGSFHEQYKFCPQCGAEMDGGIYHERKKKILRPAPPAIRKGNSEQK